LAQYLKKNDVLQNKDNFDNYCIFKKIVGINKIEKALLTLPYMHSTHKDCFECKPNLVGMSLYPFNFSRTKKTQCVSIPQIFNGGEFLVGWNKFRNFVK